MGVSRRISYLHEGQRDTENWMVRVGGWVGEDSNYRRKKV